MKIIGKAAASTVAALLAMTGVPAVAFADATGSVAQAATEERPPAYEAAEADAFASGGPFSADDARAARSIYVKTGIAQGGNGTAERPFNDFKDAYDVAKSGDTIVCLNAASIRSGVDGDENDGMAVIAKDIDIVGAGSASAINVRDPLVLAADLALRDIEFGARSISMNGHSLTMDGAKPFKTNEKATPVVFGGVADGVKAPAENQGPSVLTVRGSVGDPFVFQDIYAGSQSAAFDNGAAIDLQSGAKVLGTVSALGASGASAGSVRIGLGNVNVSSLVGAAAAADSELAAEGFNAAAGVSMSGFSKVVLDASVVSIGGDDAFSGNGAVELKGSSKLDLPACASPVQAASLSSTAGCVLMLGKQGRLDVEETLSGSVELRTPGMAADTSGPAALGRTYVSASRESRGEVTFRPYITQQAYALTRTFSGERLEWTVALEGASLADIAFAPDNRVAVRKGTTDFAMTFLDDRGAPLSYAPMFDEVSIAAPDGSPVPEDAVCAAQDDGDPSRLVVDVFDESMAAGTYTFAFADLTSGAVVEKPFEFYKDDAPEPGPEPEPDPGPNPEPDPGPGGGSGGGTIEPNPEPNPDPEPAPEPGTPEAPVAPPSVDGPDHEGVCPGAAFDDIEAGQWYHEAVDYVAWNGIMTGTSPSTFEPDSTTTRAMTAMVLWRMAGEPEPQGLDSFSDVDRDAWYAKAVAWASEAGVAHGYGEAGTFFGPEDKVTREQLATFLMRFASHKGLDTSSRADLSVFGDASDIGAFAQDALSWGVAQGLFKGIGETMTLAPQDDSTRAQMAALLMRFCRMQA